MQKRKVQKKTKRIQKKKTQKRRTRRMRLKRGGDCGCNKNNPFFSGGSDFGPASFSNTPISTFYPFNPHTVSTDPQAPVNVVDTRLAPSPLINPLSTQIGGEVKKDKRKKKKRSKKTRGGGWIDSLNMNNALPNTTASLFGTSNISPITQLYNTNTYPSSLHTNLASINDFHNAYQPIV